MPPPPDKPKGATREDSQKAERRVRRCPICGKPAVDAIRPFCSSRCRDVDLNRWLSGTYVVPGSENDEEDAK